MKNKHNQGYALLFTFLTISIIVAVASGTALTLSKNLVLSSTARESQIAFYQADTAGECALYASLKVDLDTKTSFDCGDSQLVIDKTSAPLYKLNSQSGTNTCLDIEINKITTTSSAIKVKGYNNCKSNRIERGIEINF